MQDVFYETIMRFLITGSEYSEDAIRALIPYIIVWAPHKLINTLFVIISIRWFTKQLLLSEIT